jgi:hypothetical protein
MTPKGEWSPLPTTWAGDDDDGLAGLLVANRQGMSVGLGGFIPGGRQGGAGTLPAHSPPVSPHAVVDEV